MTGAMDKKGCSSITGDWLLSGKQHKGLRMNRREEIRQSILFMEMTSEQTISVYNPPAGRDTSGGIQCIRQKRNTPAAG